MFEANQSGKQLRLPQLPTESLQMWPELLSRAIQNPLRNAKTGGTGLGLVIATEAI